MQTKKLNIKLISPRMSLRPMDSEFKRVMSPSLSLVTIASLTPRTHKVYIEDENLRKINFNDHPDLVGITVNVDTSQRAFEIASEYRKKNVKVIFGGIHASANSEEMLKHCDSVCIGEAEEIWGMIVEDQAKGKLQSIYSYDKITDLSKYPLPDWNYVKREYYLYHNIIITSRGCPFKCEFCYNSCKYVKNPYRNRPVENVLEDIRHLRTRHIMFIDDNLIGNLSWLKAFMKKITPLRLVWHGASSTNLVNHPEVMDQMAESGCRSLFIGFESINSQSVRSANKKQNNVENYEKLIRALHQRNIMVNASLVFGFDSDDTSVFDNTLKWLIRNKVETMTSHILTPYPGTKLYERLIAERRIIDFNLTKYNTSNVVFRPRLMSAEELYNGYLWIYKEFYSMKNVLKRMPENRSLIAPFLMFNLGYRKYGNITSFLGRFGLMNQIGKMGRKLSYGFD